VTGEIVVCDACRRMVEPPAYLTGSERGDIASALRNTAAVAICLRAELEGVAADPAVLRDVQGIADRLVELARTLDREHAR
jgi:hypothetical protein